MTLKSLTVGASSGTQMLMVGSSGSANAILTTTAGISNGAHGVLTMVNGDSAGNNVTLVGPIVNAGLFATELVHGGSADARRQLHEHGDPLDLHAHVLEGRQTR